ncbi:MAG: hypothetical protein WA908_02775 [Pontixanthobacter sp.]
MSEDERRKRAEDHTNIESRLVAFFAERTNGEVMLMAFLAAILLFVCGVVVGRAVGSL